MGTSSRTKHKGINVSAGGLVWVKRRNGSWWPGRILGLDELPEMCPRSPRLETPVKLLGRKDAIVVWYNLEKSRCVKAFRCGDFDECIKNAKASASQCTKVAVKYASRNDAILHALKIENAHGSNCSHQFCLREGDIIGKVTVESCSTQDFTQSTISFETVHPTNGSREDGFMQKKRRKTPNDSEDDGNEGSKRMRDLDDIGLRLVPIQNSGEHPEVVFSDGSDICDSLSNSSPVNSTKGSSVYLRRRYSNVGYHVHERLKRKSRCRSISKVLESTSMVDFSALGNEDIMDVKVSVESLDSVKTNFSRVINTNSDSTGTSCQKDIVSSNVSEDTANGEKDVTVFHGSPELKDNVSSGLDIHDTGCYHMPSVLKDDQTEDKVCSSKMAFMQSNSEAHAMCSASVTYHDCVEGRIERDTSKQQRREKRNPQLFGKDIDFEKRTAKFKDYLMNADVLLHGSIVSDGWSQLRNEAIHWKKLNAVAQSLSRNEDSQLTTGILPSQHSHSTTYFPLTGYLFDVYLEVQATYKGDYVPLVSVTSKLNGKAIVGRPITVDVLEDGFCDNLMTSIDLWPRTSSCELYNLQRTESLEPLIDVVVQTHQCGYLPQTKMEAKVCNPTHLSVGLGRLSKFRKCTNLPKKTRKLSSIAVEGEPREQERKVALMDNWNSLDTACVPLKVVFRRINEAFGC
ncbi:uncharacterized protein At1g51745-like isoform X2 [Aristolochia californica]|uniref:uncharacterized protein At1g51745-like isoform X2 n=1 Tax=Aristolochia californica TaxID=171875 RepID=UPI0035E0FB5B